MNEKLSAFLDNEATRDEVDCVVSELLADESLRDSWTRQHWIRATLRAGDSEPAVVADINFSKRVMAAIDDEQPIQGQPHSRKVVPMQRPRRLRHWRGIGGLAAAASVAGIVMLSGNPFVGTERAANTQLTASANSASAPARQVASNDQNDFSGEWNDQLADFSFMTSQHPSQVRTVAVNNAATTNTAGQWSVSDPAVRDELNGYLADHNGMAGGYGMYRTTPALVRVAAYDHGMVTQ